MVGQGEMPARLPAPCVCTNLQNMRVCAYTQFGNDQTKKGHDMRTGLAKATDYRVMDAARREHEVMRAIRDGAVYRSVLLHRLNVPSSCLQRTLTALLEDGLIAATEEKQGRQRFKLLPPGE